MTKIAIVPNAAGTGTFTIEAPNSNSNRTLTLPDAAGELLTDAENNPAKLFRRDNILGTVSQSAGVPTGAIIERGSNANGDFVKYADGTAICFGTYLGGITVGATVGITGLSAGNVALTMPTTAAADDVWRGLSFSGNNNENSEGWGGKSATGSTATVYTFRYFTSASSVTATAVHWAVIGRWF
jgi:hypothetical protein